MVADKQEDKQNPNDQPANAVDPLKPAEAAAPANSGLGMSPQADDEEIIDFDPQVVDRALSEADPKFVEKLQELKTAEFKTQIAIEAVDLETLLKEGESKKSSAPVLRLSFKERIARGLDRSHARISKIIDDFQNGSVSATKATFRFIFIGTKTLLKFIFGQVGGALKWVLHLPKKTKLLAAAVIVLGAAASFSIYMSLRGHFLPQIGREYLTGFSKNADQTFEYKDTDSKETFDSEIRHPEHMYEVEKVVVNLKGGTADSEHLPMGLFEFYIELNSQEASIEVSDRRTELKHVIERVLEQLTYEELVTVQGKNKMKFILRKEINEFLSKSHHVRQIYIKSIVLKP